VPLRSWIKRLERVAGEETTVLVCQECGEEWRVSRDLDLEYITWEWLQATGEENLSGRPIDPDVHLIDKHPHSELSLIDKSTGEPWLKGLLGPRAWEDSEADGD
jgi:hypothetical protein